jgi:hypothetical protein
MSAYIIEPERRTEIKLSADIVVVGGGIAGASAAIAAARKHKRVILVEREYALGGMATLGLVTIFLPLCDGMGHQLVYGIGEELLRLSIRHTAEVPVPDAWLSQGSVEEKTARRYMAQFNPNLFALSLEQLLRELGVTILYGTLACGAQREGRTLQSVVVENKSGRSAIEAECFIDCSGDADLCALAGIPTQLYAKGNGLASWYYYSSANGVRLKMFGLADVPQNRTGEQGGTEQENVKVDSLDPDYRFSGVDGYELSEAIQYAHEKMFEDILTRKQNEPSYLPTTISSVPLVRMSRRLCGAYTLDLSEDHKQFADSVGMVGDWRKRGPAFEIPFRTLYSEQIDNLLVAGRIISVTDAMWDVTRVIPACAVTGQAAGTAAALGGPVGCSVAQLQSVLQQDAVKLHE